MNRRTGAVAVIIVIGLVITLGYALSRDSGDGSSRATVWNESDIVDHMGLRPDGGSWVFTTDDGVRCDVAVVLTSANQVDLYKGAGDTVATNPGETAGVKIVTSERRTCLDAATVALSDLD